MNNKLGDRTKYIGGSDVAAILGMSRWKTKLTVWMEKVGLIPYDNISSTAAEVGIELEDYVARRFTRKTKIEVKEIEGGAIYDKEKKYFIGHPDRETIIAGDLVECKTCGEWKAKEWKDDEIPGDYILQVYFYLMLNPKYKKAYIPYLIGNREFDFKTINRTPDIENHIKSMRAKLIDFWENYVIPKKMPMDVVADDKDPLTILYPINKIPKMIELPEKLIKRFELRESMIQDLFKMEKEIDKIENETRAEIGKNDGGLIGLWKATWKTQKSSGCPIDLKLFKKEEPEIYKKYLKKDNTTRVLRIIHKEE